MNKVLFRIISEVKYVSITFGLFEAVNYYL